MKQNVSVSEMDNKHYRIIRRSVSNFLEECSRNFDREGGLLDIAPQEHEGAGYYFKRATIRTLDIDPDADADFTLDICVNNRHYIKDNYFDFVVCTEVLEHTRNPFKAVDEIYRVLKPNGYAFVTVPFNFRIHGPLPDCWRFTEHGLRELFKQFDSFQINSIGTKSRDLMPIHYTIIVRK